MIEEKVSRIVDPKERNDLDSSLRPTNLKEFIGQKKAKDKMRLLIDSAISRGDSSDHILLSGPPGLGKTTLATIVAKELNSNIKITSAPTLTKTGDIAKMLTDLNNNDILFIDEIHRLSRTVEEVLYSPMEEYRLDILIGKGQTSKSITLPLKKFTLVGATTMSGKLSSPLRSRFGMHIRLDYYDDKDLALIDKRYAELIGIDLDDDALLKLAGCSRGTPRIAIRILRRVRDFAVRHNKTKVDLEMVKETLRILEIDDMGLDFMDRKILNTLIKKYDGGPASLDTIAMSIGEEAASIYEVYEPFLLQLGFISRTNRGRIATDAAYRYLNINR
ncbi:MAG: Holliday junction branch migration DNA helicase RuvB [Candidatus Muiribacterium halophilum]|uniref:Holliday junction branch migration complex subunit RuvB n=1 Tax=Muiribacterium halophilum TaxID=2053465 RepID=A0A2N5ZFN0_MUIH1|nr:MAG: Holliday junction branch migration DNA helicase RuvB [Candidatus Muirbacterium halophilum]